MKPIDLHQDIILTFDANPQMFFSDEGKTMKPNYNAWVYSDYVNNFELVVGAVVCPLDQQRWDDQPQGTQYTRIEGQRRG